MSSISSASGQVAVAVGFLTRDPSLIWNTGFRFFTPGGIAPDISVESNDEGCFPLCQTDQLEISGNTGGRWNNIF